ncbi:MAG: hypothetical protein ABIK37_07335, partial [candidate division WOR-3 bacterium]
MADCRFGRVSVKEAPPAAGDAARGRPTVRRSLPVAGRQHHLAAQAGRAGFDSAEVDSGRDGGKAEGMLARVKPAGIEDPDCPAGSIRERDPLVAGF